MGTSSGVLNASGAWALSGTASGTIWAITVGTVNFTGSITIAAASANSRTFAGFGRTYGSLTYTVAGSTGALVVTGANTFGSFHFSDASNARSLTMPAGVLNTFTNPGGFDVFGSSGKVVTLISSSPGSAAQLSYLGGGTLYSPYMSIQDSAPAQTSTWYAGHNSTFVSNTGNWIAADVFTKGFTANMGFSSNEPKTANISLTAGMTLDSVNRKTAVTNLQSTVSFASDASKKIGVRIAAVLGLSATFYKALSHTVEALLDFFGKISLRKVMSARFTATVSFMSRLNTHGR
jgi:hypothetical protein